MLAHTPFLVLWLAQICSPLTQNLTWLVMGAFVANQTHSSTFVSATIVSALLAQLLLSSCAGVLVDRSSKRAVLALTNLLRVGVTVLFLLAVPLPLAWQTSVIIALVFVANAIAQYFVPAEAATIPLIVNRHNPIVATSLFNITINVCQVIPLVGGLVLFDLFGLVPVLVLVAGLYALATVCVLLLPASTRSRREVAVVRSLAEAVRQVGTDLHEALVFLRQARGLRLILVQVNVPPTFMFIFGVLGLAFMQQTFGLAANRAWMLLLLVQLDQLQHGTCLLPSRPRLGS